MGRAGDEAASRRRRAAVEHEGGQVMAEQQSALEQATAAWHQMTLPERVRFVMWVLKELEAHDAAVQRAAKRRNHGKN